MFNGFIYTVLQSPVNLYMPYESFMFNVFVHMLYKNIDNSICTILQISYEFSVYLFT